MRVIAACVLALCCSTWQARASQGDASVAFQSCVLGCRTSPACQHTARVLLVVPWSCEDECRYQCMHEIESRRVHGPAVQYFGKWPFNRFLGVQEPLSTLFSLLNGFPHLRELVVRERRRRYVPEGGDPAYRVLLLAGCVVGVNTWLWSAVFHAKDTWWTERLDYHFATVHMGTMLLLAVGRLALLFQPTRVRSILVATSLVTLGGIARHVWWLNAVHFDYGYNMLVTGIVVVAQALTWVAWAAAARTRGAAHWWMVCVFQACLLGFASFEAFDFPPVGGWLDAHAVWHGLTVPLVFLWYQFQEADAKWRVKHDDVKAKDVNI